MASGLAPSGALSVHILERAEKASSLSRDAGIMTHNLCGHGYTRLAEGKITVQKTSRLLLVDVENILETVKGQALPRSFTMPQTWRMTTSKTADYAAG